MDKDLPIIFQFEQHNPLYENIIAQLPGVAGKLAVHTFPDTETLMSLQTDVKNKAVILVCSTNLPDKKITKLIFFAETAKALGARSVGLVSPYLAYMRQDTVFHPGEGVSAHYFAKMLSTYFDWLLTVDPHLHRLHSLDAVFTIPGILLHATNPIAKWIAENVNTPVLIGPDKESEQWVAAIANTIKAPYLIVEKTRFSDTDVQATIPNLHNYKNHTAVLVDDIISTGKTLMETIHHLQKMAVDNIICIGVHAVFAGNAYAELQATGVKAIITCNTIVHPSNQIDLSALIIAALAAND